MQALLASAISLVLVTGGFGSLSAGAATAVPEACDVTNGILTWGFKESFRSYISGTIANGKWTTADGATYTTPNFGWSGGEGSYGVTSGSGTVGFTGSITFTGHGGILNTTVANPVIRFDKPNSAVLLLDVSGTTQEGAEIDEKSVEFVHLNLSKAAVDVAEDGTVTIADTPAELTKDGAVAFGTYETGEQFDPVTVSFVQNADCAVTVIPSRDGASLPASVIAALLVIAAVITVVILRRKSKPDSTET